MLSFAKVQLSYVVFRPVDRRLSHTMTAPEATDAPVLFEQLPTVLSDCVLDYTRFADCVSLRLLRRGAGAAIADAWARKTTLRLLPEEWERLGSLGATAFWALAQRCRHLHAIAVGPSHVALDDDDNCERLYVLVGCHAQRLRKLRLLYELQLPKGVDALAGCIVLESLQLSGLSEVSPQVCEKLVAACPQTLRDLDLSEALLNDNITYALLNGLADAGVRLETLKLSACFDTLVLAATARHPLRALNVCFAFPPTWGIVRDAVVEADMAQAVHNALRTLLCALRPSLHDLTLGVYNHGPRLSKKMVAALSTPLPLSHRIERLVVRGDYTPPFIVSAAADDGARPAALNCLHVHGNGAARWDWGALFGAAKGLAELRIDVVPRWFATAGSTKPVRAGPCPAGATAWPSLPTLRRLACKWQVGATFDSVLAACPRLEFLSLSCYGKASMLPHVGRPPPTVGRSNAPPPPRGGTSGSSPPRGLSPPHGGASGPSLTRGAAAVLREHKALVELELSYTRNAGPPPCGYKFPALRRLELSTAGPYAAWRALRAYVAAAAPTLKCLEIGILPGGKGWSACGDHDAKGLPDSLPLLSHCSLDTRAPADREGIALLRRAPMLKSLDLGRSEFSTYQLAASTLSGEDARPGSLPDVGRPNGVFSRLECLAGALVELDNTAHTAVRDSFLHTAPNLRGCRCFAGSAPVG